MLITKEYSENILIVKPEFNFDMESLEKLSNMKNKIEEWIENKNFPIIIFDLNSCISIDTIGLGAMVRIFEQLRKRKGKLALYNVTENIRELLINTTLDRILICYDNLEQALNRIKKEG